jgi:hypothetical protein
VRAGVEIGRPQEARQHRFRHKRKPIPKIPSIYLHSSRVNVNTSLVMAVPVHKEEVYKLVLRLELIGWTCNHLSPEDWIPMVSPTLDLPC